MKRTSSRVLIGNPVDDHCGINCLQQFLRPFGAMPSYRRKNSTGRSEMAQALRNKNDSLLECSYYSPTSTDIYLRAGIHEVAMVGEPCTGAYWVENIDPIAWSLETKKKVCVITNSNNFVVLWCTQEYLSRSVYRCLSSVRMLMILSSITLTEFTMRRCFTSMKTSFKLKTFLMIFMQRIAVAYHLRNTRGFLVVSTLCGSAGPTK